MEKHESLVPFERNEDAGNIVKVAAELVTRDLTTDFDLSSLPRELREELTQIRKDWNYYSGKINYYSVKLNETSETKQRWDNKLLKWFKKDCKYGPEDIRESKEWERWYAAIILDDDVALLKDDAMLTAWERNPFDQRSLATELITGRMTKVKMDALLQRSQALLCSTNPTDENYFSVDTLKECCVDVVAYSDEVDEYGKKIKITMPWDDARVNEILGRRPSTYVRADTDYREALRATWKDRDERAIQRAKFNSGDWDYLEPEIIDTFSAYAWLEVTRIDDGAIDRQLRLALWSILTEAQVQGGSIRDYFLDPRKEETWEGIRDFSQLLREQPIEQWYYELQGGAYLAQQWMREIGMFVLYGDSADWWVEVPNVTHSDLRYIPEREDGYMTYYREHFRMSKVKELVANKYKKRLTEGWKNANA